MRWENLALETDHSRADTGLFGADAVITRTFDTPEFRDRTERWFGGRSGFIGLTWNFGGQGKRPTDPTFDFSGPTTGG